MSPNWKSLVRCTCLFRTMCLLHLSCCLSSGFQVLCSLKAAIGSCGCACSFLHSQYRNHGKVVLKHRPAECAPTIREMLNWCRKCRIKGKIVSVRYPTIAKCIQRSKSCSFFFTIRKKDLNYSGCFMGCRIERVKEGWCVMNKSQPEGLLDSFTSKWAGLDKAVHELLSIRKHEKMVNSLQMHLMFSNFLSNTYQTSLCFTMVLNIPQR